MNNHDLDKDELAEVFKDAAIDYVASGDRIGYIRRMQALGIIGSEIKEHLRELDIKRAENFNRALEEYQKGRNRNGKAA